MNWDRVEGNWKQFKGSVRREWGKLTDDSLDVIAGRRELLAGRIQELYGISREEVERQIRAFEKRYADGIDEVHDAESGRDPNASGFRRAGGR